MEVTVYLTTCWNQNRFPPQQSAAHFQWRKKKKNHQPTQFSFFIHKPLHSSALGLFVLGSCWRCAVFDYI